MIINYFMQSKNSQTNKPKRWHEMGLSDMPQKQPVIAWILRITVGTALGATLALVATVPNLPQFRSQAQINHPSASQPVYNIFKPQAAATATLSLSPSSGNFNIGEIFSIDIQLNTGGAQIVAVAAYLRYDKAKLEVASIDPSGSVFAYEAENTIDADNGRIFITRGQPTPGVNGSSLQVARVNFKGLAAVSGSAITLDFTGVDANGDSGAILNDGLGSDVLSAVSNGSYNISAASCMENWTCTNWSACSNGQRIRTCSDSNSCGTTAQKPIEAETCSFSACSENWSCTAWSDCSDNQRTRACADGNSCGTETDKPIFTQDCSLPTNTDSVAPNAKIVSGPLKPVKAKMVKISWDGLDDQTAGIDLEFSFRLDNGPWSPYQKIKEKEFTGLHKGGHIIEVKARDQAGNEDKTPAKISFIVDSDTGVIVGPAQGGSPQIRVLDLKGKAKKQFYAYEKSFRGGVSFAVKDLGDDAVREIITGPGKGREPEVRIFRMDGSIIDKFLAYPKSFRGGINVAAGDLDGDGNKEIIVSPQSGIQKVKTFKFQKGKWTSVNWDFSAYAGSPVGVNIAIGDFDGDRKDEVAAVPSIGGSAIIKIFGLRNGKMKLLAPQIQAFTKKFRGGAYIASGDLNADGKDEILVSVASNGGPQIQIFGVNRAGRYALTNPGFYAFSKKMKNGVAIGVGDIDGSGKGEIIAAIAGRGAPIIRIFSPNGKTKLHEFRGLPFKSFSGLRVGEW